MSKLSYEDKINIYNERKQGNSVINISKRYDVRKDVIKYLIRLIDKHGYDILRTSKNRIFTKEEKERISNRVLIGQTDTSWSCREVVHLYFLINI